MKTISTGAKTLENIIEEFQVDLEFREPWKLKTNTRQGQQKQVTEQLINDKVVKTTEPVIVDLFQSEVNRLPKYWWEAPEWCVEIMKDILQWKWVMRPTFPILKPVQEKNLWWLMLTDLHLDLMDNKNNTFNNRCKQVNERSKKVLDRLFKFDIDKLLVAQMWDLFNSDSKFKTSSHKVVLQNNLHERDSFRRVLDWTVGFLEWLKEYWIPLEYRIVPWNHDYEKTQHYGVALEYYFWDSMDVKTERNRAYIPRWDTLIALWHWDNEKPTNFLQYVMNEYIAKGKKAKNIVGYLGNQHRQIIWQNWPMLIKNLLAPTEKSDWCDNKWYDMIQGMHWFVRDKKEWEIAEVRG